MTTRQAQCLCGNLKVTCTGDAARISMCHCVACQRRTGVVFSTNSRFLRSQIQIEGDSTAYVRTADSGNTVTAHFCPTCGSTVYWELSGFSDLIAVASGMFADPSYPAPKVAVWEETKHPWTDAIAAQPMDRFAKV